MGKQFLLPGKLAFARGADEITTVLGSCVAITLADESAKVFGMNHYLLPKCESGSGQNPRYGEYAIETLVKHMESHGASVVRMKAQIYGGAEILDSMSSPNSVGVRNIELADRMLRDMGIKVVHRDVGGKKSRKVTFFTGLNKVESVTQVDPGDRTGFAKVFTRRDVKVLVVDDSATIRGMFSKIFKAEGLTVVGMARDAFEAREMLIQYKPDVMTLDIEMPKMNGVKFLDKVMQHMPVPTVMVSSLSSDGQAAMKSLELGAVEFIQKPSQSSVADLQKLGRQICQKVRAAASVDIKKLVATRGMSIKPLRPAPMASSSVQSPSPSAKYKDITVIGVGGNASAQAGLSAILKTIQDDTPPMVVAVSTVAGFVDEYIQKNQGQCKASLKKADNGQTLSVGCIYIVPVGFQVEVSRGPFGPVLALKPDDGRQLQSPSADVLFESIARSYKAAGSGILLSGFGSDGVKGLASLSDSDATTFVQDPSTCLFPHGPQSAIDQGVAGYVVSPDVIAARLWSIRNAK